MMNNRFVVAPWCATNVYKKNGSVRAYIRNEITTEYFLLEDFSALIWKKIIDFAPNDELFDFAKTFDESEDSVNNFLLELKNSMLILDLNSDNYSRDIVASLLIDENANCSNSEFHNSMFSWFAKNQIMANLFIETTCKCNLNCIHCYNCKNIDVKGISFEDLKPVIDEAYENGLFSVILSGGETTITPDFLKIAKYIRSKHISLEIYTNGLSLYNNDELFNEILNLYPSKISLSLYSMNPEIHDKITGVCGSQEKTLSVIKKLKQYNMPIEVKCFLTKYNPFEFKKIAKFCKENNITSMFDEKFYNNPENNNSYVEVTDEQLTSIYSSYYEIFGENIPETFNEKYVGSKECEPCRAGHFGLSISADLSVQMCNFFGKKIGNLKEDSIVDIWNEKTKNCSELIAWRKVVINDLKECYKHDYCKFCFYCVGFSLNENNYLGKSNTLCRVAKARFNAFNEIKKHKE